MSNLGFYFIFHIFFLFFFLKNSNDKINKSIIIVYFKKCVEFTGIIIKLVCVYITAGLRRHIIILFDS